MTGDLDTDLAIWLAEQRADAAAASRAREHWLRSAADEDAFFAGLLLDLAETFAVTVLQVLGGRTIRARVTAVAADFVVIRSQSGESLLRLNSILSMRSDGANTTGSDRVPALSFEFRDALATIAAERPRVLVIAQDGTALSGELRVVGRDIATIRLSSDGGTAYLPLEAMSEVVLVR